MLFMTKKCYYYLNTLKFTFYFYSIVVVARDGGEVPQETSAFITVRLTVSNDLRPPSVIPTTSTELSKLEIIYFKGEELSEFFPINQPFGYLAGINGFNIEEIGKCKDV